MGRLMHKETLQRLVRPMRASHPLTLRALATQLVLVRVSVPSCLALEALCTLLGSGGARAVEVALLDFIAASVREIQVESPLVLWMQSLLGCQCSLGSSRSCLARRDHPPPFFLSCSLPTNLST